MSSTQELEKILFEIFSQNENKYQIKVEKYLIHKKEEEEAFNKYEKEEDALLCYTTVNVPIVEPRITIWEYMSKEEMSKFMICRTKAQATEFISERLAKSPKGVPRTIFIELMFSVWKFCRKQRFDLTQSAALLSQFYLTHIYFTSKFDIGAEKLYNYFKDLQLCHSLPFPPHNIKLFNLTEIKDVMIFFCGIYLRNLPLIRFLSLPNFAVAFKCHLEPESPLLSAKSKSKKGKGKKGKKK